MKVPKFDFVEALISAYSEAEVFLVGGAVRDLLIQRSTKDYDFVVRGIEMEDLQKFLSNLGEVNFVGKNFGVLKFKPKESDQIFDIALPRREFSKSFRGAYRDFSVEFDSQMEIEKDLARRDYTINAMAFNLNKKELIDPFSGQADLEKKQLRTVGSAITRFQEDYSRMLRGVRFAITLNFSLTDRTKEAISSLAHHIQDKQGKDWVVPREIISKEFTKAFDYNPVRAVKLMDEVQILDILMPEIINLKNKPSSFNKSISTFDETLQKLDQYNSTLYKKNLDQAPLLISKLATLFSALPPKLGQNICKQYHLVKCDEMFFILSNLDFADNNYSLVQLEKTVMAHPSLLQALTVKLLAKEKESKLKKLLDDISKVKKAAKPLLSGDDVIVLLNIKPGPDVQKWLDIIREEQLNGKLNSKEEALNFIKNEK